MTQSSAHEHRLKGIALRCGAVSCFSVMSAAIKYAASLGVSNYELMFYRNAIAMPLILGWVLFGPGLRSVRTRRRKAHAVRAAIGVVSMALTFQAISMLPLAEATAIQFTAPVFATLLSAVMLREKVSRAGWVAVLAGLIGVLIMVQPGSNAIPLPGLLVGIAAALSIGLVTITIRQIGTTELATTTVFWFNVATVVLLSPGMGAAGTLDHPPLAWAVLGVVGVAGGLAQVMMTSSLRAAPVAVLAPFDYLQILWAVLLGWVLFSSLPSAAMLAGAGIIILSGVATAWREHRLMRLARTA